MNNEILKSIETKYHEILFNDKFVDNVTGVVKSDTLRKLATYPYVGSKYGEAKKVLVVGFDIGNDECKGKICSLEYRRQIENYNLRKLNPHIGGTYFTALYFLKDELKLSEFWEDTKSSKYAKTFATILKRVPKLPDTNPLSYIAMTNFYKYVTVGRTKSRRGNFDRVFIDKEREIKLFLAEIEILNPDVIFFQSKDFQFLDRKIKDTILSKGIKAYYAYHPSDYSEVGGNIPENYFSNRTFEIK